MNNSEGQIKSVGRWIDIEYKNGNKLRKDFSDVWILAAYLKENPEVAKLVNYLSRRS